MTVSLPTALRRVLFIDDSESERELLRERFGHRFEHSEFHAPKKGLEQLRKGNFDAVVVDLRLVSPLTQTCPETNAIPDGLSLLKAAGSKCQPGIILTGSISAPSVARIASNAIMPDGRRALGVALKSDPDDAILSQLLGAYEDAQHSSPEERMKVIESIAVSESNPRTPPQILKGMAADVIQSGNDYYLSFQRVLKILKADWQLESWPGWSSVKQKIEGQLAVLARLNSETLIGTGRDSFVDCLHDLRARTALLDPNLCLAKAPREISQKLRHVEDRLLEKLLAKYDDFIKIIHEAYQRAVNPIFEFEKRILELFKIDLREDIYYEDEKLRGCTNIKDKSGDIEALLILLSEIFSDQLSFPTFRVMSQNLSQLMTVTERTLQDRINFGTGIQVTIRSLNDQFAGQKWKEILAPVEEILFRLVAKKVLYADPGQFSLTHDIYENGGTSTFEFYIKTSDLDRAELEKQQLQRSKISSAQERPITIGDEEIEVQKLQVPSGEVTTINIYLPSFENAGGDFSILEFKDCLYLVSHGWGHVMNDLALCTYLVKSAGFTLDEAYQAACSSIRVKYQDGVFNLAIAEGDELIQRIKPILLDLGVKDVIANPAGFCSRCTLDWYLVSDLEHELVESSVRVVECDGFEIGSQHIEVNTILGALGSIQAISFNANTFLESGDPYSILELHDELVVAGRSSFINNEQALCYYLVNRKGYSVDQAYSLSQSSFRALIKGTEFVLEESCSQLVHLLGLILPDLGISDTYVSVGHFEPRADLPRDLIEELLQEIS